MFFQELRREGFLKACAVGFGLGVLRVRAL